MDKETWKICNTREQVAELLLKYPEYRDDDERLVAAFWFFQCKQNKIDLKEISAHKFLEIYAKNNFLVSADTIVRARAKAQQDYPNLRGEKWVERHKTGEVVQAEINLN